MKEAGERVRRGQHSEGRPRTLLDLRWPDTVEYTELARTWSEDAVTRMLAAVWCGFDTIVAEILTQIDIAAANEELERAITQLLEPRIRQHLSGNEPYDIQHGPYEYATRQPAPAQPPQYDIAFVLHQNPRVMWPLEAKLLRSDGAVADYVRDVREEFLTGRYAPYASSGAMLGYLLCTAPQRGPLTTSHKLLPVSYCLTQPSAHVSIACPIIPEASRERILCPARSDAIT